MKVLVTAASRHGSTQMIADCIREELEAAGCRVHLADPDSVADVEEYDAVVLGSAVYAGHWLKPARKLAQRLEFDLRGKPVWLFSSGPVGEPAKPAGSPIDAIEWSGRLHAQGHEVFTGRLDREQLGFGERLVVRAVDAPNGDYRSWLVIGRWARSIATALKAMEASASVRPAAIAAV